MSRGYQADELAEHAALTELAAAEQAVTAAIEHRRYVIRRALDQGARAHVLAEQIGVSRATLFRMVAD